MRTLKTITAECREIEMEIKFTCPYCLFDMWDCVDGYKGVETEECPKCGDEFNVKYDADGEGV